MRHSQLDTKILTEERNDNCQETENNDSKQICGGLVRRQLALNTYKGPRASHKKGMDGPQASLMFQGTPRHQERVTSEATHQD